MVTHPGVSCGVLRLAPWLICCACRLHFDAEPMDGRASCTWSTFGGLRDITEVNSSSDDWGAWISNDKLELYFGSSRAGAFAIYHASRSAPGDAFGTPMLLANLVASGSADDPFITDDGLQLFFENSPTTLGKDAQLNVAIRASTSVEFANARVLSNVNDPSTQDAAPSLTSDALTLVFNSERAGGPGGSDLYLATRQTASSAFGTPVPLSIDTSGFDCCTSIAGDGSSMILVNDSTGAPRIMAAARGGTDFTPPALLAPELAGATGSEIDPTLTRDGTTIVFSSNRAGGQGGYDIYLAERSCL